MKSICNFKNPVALRTVLSAIEYYVISNNVKAPGSDSIDAQSDFDSLSPLFSLEVT